MVDTIMSRLAQNKFVLIAEIGVNYYDVANKMNISLMEAAKFMVLSAKNVGVHAVKFQTYKAESLASKDSPSYWDTNEEETTSQYELFKKFDRFGEKEYRDLSIFCEQIGVEFLSTPFDFVSADYLDSLMNVYKISSSDLNNLPFVEYIAKKQKPILLSVGASNLDEIIKTVNVIRSCNQSPLVLLHCVLEYPTPYEHANLKKINMLRKEFPDAFVGYSDHTKPDMAYTVLQTAYAMGATVIEKHFTVDKSLSGNDHYHAMDVNDVEKILDSVRFIDRILGMGELSCLKSEQVARRNARRSIVAAKDIPKGAKIVREMLTFKRPGTGIPPSCLDEVIGSVALDDIKADIILTRNMILSNRLS